MAQADSQFTTRRAFLGSPETELTTKAVISPNAVRTPDVTVSDPEAADPICTSGEILHFPGIQFSDREEHTFARS